VSCRVVPQVRSGAGGRPDFRPLGRPNISVASLQMDFFKKVITSVSFSGLAPGFPYCLDEQLASESEVSVTAGIWSIHRGHHTSFKSVLHNTIAMV